MDLDSDRKIEAMLIISIITQTAVEDAAASVIFNLHPLEYGVFEALQILGGLWILVRPSV